MIEREGDGFLKDMNQWSEEIIYEMAKEDGFELTDEVKGLYHESPRYVRRDTDGACDQSFR